MDNQNFNFQPPLFTPKREMPVIECFECKRESHLDGYRFRLVPICACCRDERALEILSNQIERRARRD